MTTVDEIKTRMQELIEFISQANETIQGGEMVDLMGLDDEVASLCDRTLALPPEHAVIVQPLMAEMISKLESLGETLKDFQDNIGKSSS